jgi:hypothetical protein
MNAGVRAEMLLALLERWKLMPVWVAALFGVLVIGLGAARLYTARSRRQTSLPWSRREDRTGDFSTRAPYDQFRTDLIVGAGLVVVGLIIVVVFGVVPAFR